MKLLFLLVVACIYIHSENTICESQVDLVFMLDDSGSINYRDTNNWNRMLDFVNNIIKRVIIEPAETQIGVLIFDTEIRNPIYLNSYENSEDLMLKVRTLMYGGRLTNTAGALEMLRTSQFNIINSDHLNVKNVAIIITDGEPTLRINETFTQAQLAKDAGIQILSIGVSNSVGIETIKQLSSNPEEGKDFFLMNDFSDLNSNSDSIYRVLCEAIVALPTTTHDTEVEGGLGDTHITTDPVGDIGN